jgi:hypothetical protein
MQKQTQGLGILKNNPRLCKAKHGIGEELKCNNYTYVVGYYLEALDSRDNDL